MKCPLCGHEEDGEFGTTRNVVGQEVSVCPDCGRGF